MYCITCLNCTLKKNLQYINLLNKLGLCVSAGAAEKKKSDFSSRQKSHIEHMFLAEKKLHEENSVEEIRVSSDINGDNFDTSKSPPIWANKNKEKVGVGLWWLDYRRTH